MAMVDVVRGIIVAKVKVNETVTYGEVMDAVGLDRERADHRRDFGLLLAKINDDDLENERPSHSAAVVLAGGTSPARGFWEYVDDRGLRKAGESDDEVFVRLQGDLFNYYGARQNDPQGDMPALLG